MPQNFCSTEPFTVTSQDGRSFFVHGSILAAQSQPFRTLISGDWEESAERTISLEDWDSDTVSRLIEFLYTGNYQYSDPEPLSPETVDEVVLDQEEGPKAEELDSEDEKLNRPLTPLDQCLDPSLCREDKIDVKEKARIDTFGHSDKDYDYKAILLAHAKVYALAQYKDVTALKALSLERLLMVLSSIHSNKFCTDDYIAANIAELLGYVYSHTDSPGMSEEPMRRIVSQFAALNFTTLQAKKEFSELIGEGGDFARDLTRKVCRMILGLESKMAAEWEKSELKLKRERIEFGNELEKQRKKLELQIKVQMGETEASEAKYIRHFEKCKGTYR